MSNAAIWPDAMIIGIGVDIVHIPRIKRAVLRWGGRFTSRIFTEDELEYYLGRKDPYQGLALCFAAKEACSKALGVGIGKTMGWRDVSITHLASGKPMLNLTGSAFKISQELGASLWHVSLSHEAAYGVAMVVAET
ncbi:MAG: holo-ACP synthase [Dissulfurimicrobium sp.]|uniref:holo-ACP synthase n=1 Tax=Dissulfurimicrobium TaxID=1769732 RepID=UPI001EDA9EB5|nr:holo-ACP synthase [Dissulfurimicrobium hydrothermale]UKL13255.1 holo-ACP synthase [Dissulfurimicrobium hydrothermale]